jgi:hypothetical protein
MGVKASRLGISESATLALALIVTLALAGIAIAFFQSYAQSASNAVKAEAASQVERMSEEVSIVYWIGSRLMLKNDGEKPVTLQRIFTDSGIIEQTVTIQPGEKKVLTVPQSDLLVLQTSGGSIIKLRNPQPQAGGGVSGGLEITEAQATRVGTNAQIKTKVKNTSSQVIYSISLSIVGENGKTYVAPKNWLLNPGEEVQDTTVLPISEYGTQYYVRVHGFLTQGGQEVSDAVWVVLQ